jgi:hypothetical protein
MKKESRAVKRNIRFGLTLVLFVVILVAACIIAPITVYFGNLTSITAPIPQDTSIGIFPFWLYYLFVIHLTLNLELKSLFVRSDVTLRYLPFSFSKKRNVATDCSFYTEELSRICKNSSNLETCDTNRYNNLLNNFTNQSVNCLFKRIKIINS